MSSAIASGIGYIVGGISLIGGAIYYNYRKKLQAAQNEQKQKQKQKQNEQTLSTNAKKPGLK
jgi:hypothetical protein